MRKQRSWIITALQTAGYKLTAPRRAVALWVERHKGVFSVKEMCRDLSSLDTVSVYRTIELLQTLDLIHPVLTTHGEVHYEKHEQTHHHHVVCSNCEKTTCVASCDIVVPKKIKGFTNLHHTLVFTGLCARCS